MQVKCLSKERHGYLTKGKIYDVIKINRDCYRILNDDGYEFDYGKSLFEIIKEDNKMTNFIKDMEKDIKEMQERMNSMKLALENAKKEEEEKLRRKVWTPKHGELYYSVYGDGTVSSLTNIEDHKDNRHIKSHNAFETRKEAERKAFERQLMGDLETFAQENNNGKCDWTDDNSNKYYIMYSNNSKSVRINLATYSKYIGQTYFTSKKVALEAMETYEADLIRYFTTKE